MGYCTKDGLLPAEIHTDSYVGGDGKLAKSSEARRAMFSLFVSVNDIRKACLTTASPSAESAVRKAFQAPAFFLEYNKLRFHTGRSAQTSKLKILLPGRAWPDLGLAAAAWRSSAYRLTVLCADRPFSVLEQGLTGRHGSRVFCWQFLKHCNLWRTWSASTASA